MSKYHAEIDLAEQNSSHVLMLEMVGSDKDVLDVGCATGYLAQALAKQGCRVSGVEYDPEAAEEARPFLEKLVVGDIAELDLAAEFGEGVFDTVVFGDVLEHLLDPEGALRSTIPLLREGGSVVISVPNVTHGSVRLALLQGRWQYTPTGLLDSTHIRFFTRRSLAELLRGVGLHVEDARATVNDALATEVSVDDGALPSGAVQWVRDQEDSTVYQFVLRAAPGEPERPWPRLAPAVQLPPVDDIHRRRALEPSTPDDVAADRDRLAAEVVELQHSLLVFRDHAMGTAAEMGRLRAEVAAAERRVADAERRTADAEGHTADAERRTDEWRQHAELATAKEFEAHKRLASALSELGQVRSSVSYRLGNTFVRPISKLRRLPGGRR